MKKSFYLTALAGLAVLASCSNNDEPAVVNSNGVLRVSASINQVKSRAAGTQWSNGDLIGVSGEGFMNIPYVTDGSAFSAKDEGIFLSGNDEIAFSAYYPYSSTISADNKIISFDVVDNDGNYTSDSEAIDFMFAPAVNASVANPDVNFMFSHSMSKMVFTVNDATNTLEAGTEATLKIENIATAGTFNVGDGSVNPGSSVGTLTTTIKLGEAASVIVPSYAEGSLPETMKLSIVIVNEEKTSNYSVAIAPSLSTGTQYNYTLSLNYGKDLNVAGHDITDWSQDDNNGELVAGDVKIANIGDYLMKDGSVVKASALTDDNKENVAGVVYYVGNPQPSVLYPTQVTAAQDQLRANYSKCFNGLAIALNNANESASKFASAKIDGIADIEFPATYANVTFTFKNLTTTSDYILGFNNTAMFNYLENNSLLTTSFLVSNLIATYNTDYAVTNASTWYLPSLPEFNKIKENYTTIKNSIEAAGGNLAQYPDYTNSGDAANYKECFYWTSNMRNGTSPFVSSLSDTSDATTGEFQNGSGGNNIGWFRFAIAF